MNLFSGALTPRNNQEVSSGGEGGTPGGSSTQLQFNDGGAFGGITGMTTDGTSVKATDLKVKASTDGTILNFLSIETNFGTDAYAYLFGGGLAANVPVGTGWSTGAFYTAGDVASGLVGKIKLNFGSSTAADFRNVAPLNSNNSFRFADGSAANPTYSFLNSDMGMYREGANTLGFATNGSLKLVINSNSNIQTELPFAFGADSTPPASARAIGRGTNTLQYNMPTGNSHSFTIQGAVVATINTSGVNINIAGTAASPALNMVPGFSTGFYQISSQTYLGYAVNAAEAFRFGPHFIQLTGQGSNNTVSTNWIGKITSVGNRYNVPTGSEHSFTINGTDRLRVNGTGVGLNGVTPVARATTGIAEAAFVENSGGSVVNVDSTFGGYTLQQIAQALQDIGVLT